MPPNFTPIFQFLNGAIRIKRYCYHQSSSRISIPQWCDQNVRPKQVETCESLISIPQWCDQNYNGSLFACRSDVFQFLNGAIRIATTFGFFCATILFQFLNGAIRIITCLPVTPVLANFNSSMVRLEFNAYFNVP